MPLLFVMGAVTVVLGCVQALLKGGADPNANAAGERPLYRAVHDPGITEALLAGLRFVNPQKPFLCAPRCGNVPIKPVQRRFV
jgi:hypothetical protein